MSTIFKFKQFEVDQNGCAMKINTDGVLLAALLKSNNPKHILDIGTGTGVIALMLAQRFENAKIAAVEIDEQAAVTAASNFNNARFSNRLTLNHISIQQYNPNIKFDMVVCNPPYFINDLQNPEKRKGIARHANLNFFDELIAKVAALLTDKGSFWFILPIKQAENLVVKAQKYGLKAVRNINLHSNKQKPAFREIICLSKFEEPQAATHFYIYETEKVYTNAYQLLLKDFFL